MVTKENADKAFWSKMYGYEITDEELMEIRENLTRFARLVAEQAQVLAQNPNWRMRFNEHSA